ncbi:MAG: GIY-YIG nuclease family protein [Chitinophagaceae bacterium]
MFIVDAICSPSRNYIYVGLTNALVRRFHQHQSGQNSTTKPYRPFILLQQESCPTRIEARIREKYLKTGVGKEFLKGLFNQLNK